MVQSERINLIATMAGQIVERMLQTHRVEYSITPSINIDASDLASLRRSRYTVDYGRGPQLLDIEELTVLGILVMQQKQFLESGKAKVVDRQLNVTLKVPTSPDDDVILAMASKTTFSRPRLVN